MKTREKTMILFVAILAVAVLLWTMPRTKAGVAAGPKTYSIKTFLQPDWELAMHETFTHYLQAAKTFGDGDYDTTIAFLKCMEYYVDYLPDLIPNRTPPPESKPINKAVFRKHIKELKQNTVRLRQLVERKQYKKATEIGPESVTKLCFDCHKEAKVPPQWQLGGYKIVDEEY